MKMIAVPSRPTSELLIRVARSIFVADDDKVAQEYGTGAKSPYRFYFKQLGEKLKRSEPKRARS